MSDEQRDAFRAYVKAWLSADLFDQNSDLYDDAWHEIICIENTGILNRCQIRMARTIVQTVYRDARAVAGL